MERIHEIVFGLQECTDFIYWMANGLRKGRLDCDHRDVYFTSENIEFIKYFDEILIPNPQNKDYLDTFPIPIMMNLIAINKKGSDKLIEQLSEGISSENERISNYLKIAKPFLEFPYHDLNYQVTEDGLVAAKYEDIIGNSPIAFPFLQWALKNTGIDSDMLWAMSSANHIRFYRHFTNDQSYGKLEEEYKPHIKKYADFIKTTDPQNSLELETLLRTA